MQIQSILRKFFLLLLLRQIKIKIKTGNTVET